MLIINAGISVPTTHHQRHLGTKSTLNINLHKSVSVTMRDSQIKSFNPVSVGGG